MATHSGDGPETALVDAAIDEFAQVGTSDASFSSICRNADVPRATAYRLFPDGTGSLEQFIYEATVRDITRRVADEVTRLGKVGFRDAVEVGVLAAVRALRESSWVQRVLRKDAREMAGYLLGTDERGVVAVVGKYAAQCAASFGSLKDGLQAEAEKFVRRLLADWIAQVPKDLDGRWPDPRPEDLADEIDLFVRAVALGSTEATQSQRQAPWLAAGLADAVL